jgi:hypothetical protein
VDTGPTVIERLYQAASGDQLAALDEVMEKAGLAWECACRWRNTEAETTCGQCGRQRETAE